MAANTEETKGAGKCQENAMSCFVFRKADKIFLIIYIIRLLAKAALRKVRRFFKGLGDLITMQSPAFT